MHRELILLILILILVRASAHAQTSAPARVPSTAEIRTLLSGRVMTRALTRVDFARSQILSEWIRLTRVNAPSGLETERARLIAARVRKLGLDVRFDSAGNLIAVRRGSGAGPAVVIDAHLDTVFQPGLNIKPAVHNGRLYAPGVGDDTRNIVAMLASISALNAANIRTKGDLIFLFSVQEETTMAGAKQFVAENKGHIGFYIALDGGYDDFTYQGIGINWYRHHFIGPGGHSRSDSPPYSATLPLAHAIERIYTIKAPASASLVINVGMLGGADVVNAKAADAWFSLDLRATDQRTIDDTEQQVSAILKQEADAYGMTLRTEEISKSPVAQIPGHRDSYLVKTAESVFHAFGFDPQVTNAGSNNASVALLAGIPALSTGCAPCSNAHALTESCEIEPLYKGIKRLIVLEVVLAELAQPKP